MRAQPPPGLPRLLSGLRGDGEPVWRSEHERVHGPLPGVDGDQLIAEVTRSGLRGRGGADFPTAEKLSAVASRRRVSAVVVNATETEPASRKDALLLSRLPHLVLDGAVLAARTVGTREIILRVPARAGRVRETLRQALDERGERLRFTISPAPSGYVAGEESALIDALNGGPGLPQLVPPRPFQRGYRGRPTLIQNAETLAQVALVARHGAHWYRQLGTAADPGSALVTISGAVASPGVYELAFGTPMSDLLAAAGGATEPLRALLVGGYFGTWVAADAALGMRLAREDLRSIGGSLGSGVIIALGARACGLAETARIIDYLAQQSARQCGPCVHGLRAVADGVAALHAGDAPGGQVATLRRWIGDIRGRGACHHPNGAVRFVDSALRVFGSDVEAHASGPCRAEPAGLPLGEAPEVVGAKR